MKTPSFRHFFSDNRLPILIGSSLILLALLEGIWLHRTYAAQREIVREQIEQTLKSTVLTMHSAKMQRRFVASRQFDSLFFSIGAPLPPQLERRYFSEKNATIRLFSKEKTDSVRVFTVKKKDSVGDSAGKVFHFSIKKNLDSVPSGFEKTADLLPKIQRFNVIVAESSAVKFIEIRDMANGHIASKRLEMPFAGSENSDSLPTNDVRFRLDSALRVGGLSLPFDLWRLPSSDLIPHVRNAIVAATPDAEYWRRRDKFAVAAYDFQGFLLRKILPEILFALFVFGATAGAFWLVFRSFLEQKRLSDLKNSFISNITHELKTPITTVGVALEALQNFDALKNPALANEYLEMSKTELARLSMLVDKVLKLSVFEQKDVELQREKVELTAVVAEVLASMKLQIEKQNATVFFQKNAPNTEGSVFNIEGDRAHLTSVVYNLFDNALKYGGKTVEIALKNGANQRAELSVSDDGVGIASAYHARIFDKFFRVPTGDVHNVKGYGLGLNYVASVVEQHGGTIRVESELGKGSRFIIVF